MDSVISERIKQFLNSNGLISLVGFFKGIVTILCPRKKNQKELGPKMFKSIWRRLKHDAFWQSGIHSDFKVS
jgi:hypothetical protein